MSNSKKSIRIIALAAMTVGGFSLSIRAADSDLPASGGLSGGSTTTRPAGEAASEADSRAIRKTLTGVTNAALTKNSFNSLPRYLQIKVSETNHASQPNHLQQPKPNIVEPGSTSADNTFKNYDDINSVVSDIQKGWKDKYGADFNLTSEQEAMVFNDNFQIVRSDIGTAARQAAERTSPADSSRMPNNTPSSSTATQEEATVFITPAAPRVGAANSGAIGSDMQGSRPQNNIDGTRLQGNKAAGSDMQAVSLSLVRPQGSEWKIREPAGTDEQALHDSLLRHLNMVRDAKANWPADQDAAYRIVSYHVLAAVADAGNSGRAAGDRTMPESNTPSGRASGATGDNMPPQ